MAAAFVQAVRAVRLAAAAYRKSAKSERTKSARAYWGRFSDLANLYATPANWRDGMPINVFPDDVMAHTAETAGFVAAGRLPGRIADAVGRGPKAIVPPERRDIEMAVAYVNAARGGRIQDNEPVRTVSRAFAVSRRTVQNWSNKFAPADCDASELPTRMSVAGKSYQADGRSQAAITNRRRKARK